MIAVKNLGCQVDSDLNHPELVWGGIKYRFPKNEVVEVPASIAYNLFGVTVNPETGQLMRDDRVHDDNGEETQFQSRLASLEPKGLMDYGTGQFANRYADPPRFNAWRDWFRNGIEFAIIPQQVRLNPDLFDKMKARSPLVQPNRRSPKPVAA